MNKPIIDIESHTARPDRFEHAAIAFDDIGPSRILYLYDPNVGLRGMVVIDTTRFFAAGGGVRMAADVTLSEVVRLARAMTWKYALLDMPCGGAKAGIVLDPADPSRDRVMAAFVEAIRPLSERGAFFPAGDMGTSGADFAGLYGNESPGVAFAEQNYEGLPLESQLTGAGVVAAAKAACEALGRSLRGATVALEGLGKVGAGAAKFFAREGARLVAVSTVHGALHDHAGLDVEQLLSLRASYGDHAIERYEGGQRVAKEELYAIGTDVLVPGARPDVLRVANAASVRARLIVPAANIPYGPGATAALYERGCIALPDFVTNAGGVLASVVGIQGGTAEEAFELVRSRVGDNVRRVLGEARTARCDPYDAGVRLARRALTGEG